MYVNSVLAYLTLGIIIKIIDRISFCNMECFGRKKYVFKLEKS